MKPACGGFSLVESLVALALLSLGMLGALALLIEGTQGHADTLRQQAALALLQDLAGRMRSNAAAAARYDTRTGIAASADCEAASPCTPEQLAASDLAHFAVVAGANFPGDETSLSVEFEPAIGNAAPDRHVLTLRWRGPRDSQPRVVALRVPALPVAG